MATVEAPPAEELTREEDAPTFGDLDIDVLRHYVISRQGRDFVLYDGLVAGLHAVSRGFFVVDTRLEQIPAAGNGQVAVVSAQVRILDPEAPEITLRAASGVADASADNVSKQMATALLRMAETRAKARALRDLLGVKMVSFEELGPGGAEDTPTRAVEAPQGAFTPRGASSPAEHILIAGRPYSRADVLAIYKKRLDEAKAAGLAIGDVDVVPPEQAPLSALVGKSQEIKRRLEAKAPAAAK